MFIGFKIKNLWGFQTIKNYYNTYVNKGLPIAPINNPGFYALKAALNCNKPAVIDLNVDPSALYSFRRDSFSHRIK